VRETALQKPRSVKKDGEEARAKLHLQPRDKTMAKQPVYLQSIEDHVKADIHTAAHGDPMQKQVFWQELYPVGDPEWSNLFLKNCAPWKGHFLDLFLQTYFGEVHEGLSHGAGNSVRRKVWQW